VRDLGTFGEVLTKQAVGVLVAAPLPGTARVAEIDRHAGGDRELGVRGYLFAVIPGERSALGSFADARRLMQTRFAFQPLRHYSIDA
jgi:hypothetical protein